MRYQRMFSKDCTMQASFSHQHIRGYTGAMASWQGHGSSCLPGAPAAADHRPQPAAFSCKRESGCQGGHVKSMLDCWWGTSCQQRRSLAERLHTVLSFHCAEASMSPYTLTSNSSAPKCACQSLSLHSCGLSTVPSCQLACPPYLPVCLLICLPALAVALERLDANVPLIAAQYSE